MQQTAQLPATVPALNLNAETIRATFQTIKDKQVRACAAMSQIKAITTDAEDKAANDLLVKVRLTLEGNANIKGVTEMIREVTREIDQFRAVLLEPKKQIEEAYERLKQARNAYATAKVQAQQAEQARIAKEKAQADEISRVKAAMRESVTSGIIAIITDLNESIRKYVAGMTLQDWDSKATRLNVKPALKGEKYNSLFHVAYNSDIITAEMYQAITGEVRKEYPYDTVNTQYIDQATGIIKMWVDDLPNIKQQLEGAESARNGNAIAAQQEQEAIAAENENKANAARQQLEQQQATAAAEIARKHEQERLNNEVAATVQQQATTARKGIRKARTAIVTAEGADLENTIVAVVRACMSHPKFTGHMKRDRKGTLAGPDKNGNPVYADWLAELLTFAAKELDADIPGITWKENITAIAK